jgi:hypothetical protein
VILKLQTCLTKIRQGANGFSSPTVYLSHVKTKTQFDQHHLKKLQFVSEFEVYGILYTADYATTKTTTTVFLKIGDVHLKNGSNS